MAKHAPLVFCAYFFLRKQYVTYPFGNSLIHGGFPFLRPLHVQNLDKWLNSDALEVGGG